MIRKIAVLYSLFSHCTSIFCIRHILLYSLSRLSLFPSEFLCVWSQACPLLYRLKRGRYGNMVCVTTHPYTQAPSMSGSTGDPSGCAAPCPSPLYSSCSCNQAGQQPFFPPPMLELQQHENRVPGMTWGDPWYILYYRLPGLCTQGSVGIWKSNMSKQCFPGFFWGHETSS